MQTSKVLLSLGSNMPPKKIMLQKALGELVLRSLGNVLLVSPFYKSMPWGNENQDWYVNACVLLETTLTPLELLDQLQKIENDYGRVRTEKWGPRPMDLDIIMFEGVDSYQDDRLTLPHPHAHERLFVLQPLLDMLPWLHINGVHIKTFIDAIAPQTQVIEKLYFATDSYEEMINMYWGIPFYHINMGLERVENALSDLGNPHLKLPPVIHIAGTNGKGSTAAILHRILQASGKKVHRYTSPHLRSYKERYIIGMEKGRNRFIADVEFEMMVAQIAPLVAKHRLTQFEALTVLAFVAFHANPADYIILETGMGGRLDATNLIAKPIATIITSISMDHMEYLGTMIESIAFEKAGIIKEKVPVIISARNPAVIPTLVDVAKKKNAPVRLVGQDWEIKIVDNAETFISTHGREVFLDILNLKGVYQLDNAGAALEVAQLLLGNQFPDDDTLDDTLSTIIWPARLENLDLSKTTITFPKDIEFIVDGSHNADGLMHFVEYMKQLQIKSPKEMTIIFSCKEGRNLQEVFSLFSYLRPNFIFIENHAAIGQVPLRDLADMATRYGFKNRIVHDWMFLKELQQDKEIAHKRYAVCGSLYFCGAFYNVLDYRIDC